ncbi:MAG TPA: transcriptional repressor [Acidimicrobiales bacterium]|nr:transcriptional repressor [Acidimicrobiales bacterium]
MVPVGRSANGEVADGAAEAVLRRLRESGARITTCRRQLVRRLVASSEHRTAEELAKEVQALVPDVHLSTIYRNLEEFERLGIVIHCHLGHGPATYHLTTQAHGHLVCERCGTTFEAPEELFSELTRRAQERFGFAVDTRHFAVHGICAACSAARAG